MAKNEENQCFFPFLSSHSTFALKLYLENFIGVLKLSSRCWEDFSLCFRLFFHCYYFVGGWTEKEKRCLEQLAPMSVDFYANTYRTFQFLIFPREAYELLLCNSIICTFEVEKSQNFLLSNIPEKRSSSLFLYFYLMFAGIAGRKSR